MNEGKSMFFCAFMQASLHPNNEPPSIPTIPTMSRIQREMSFAKKFESQIAVIGRLQLLLCLFLSCGQCLSLMNAGQLVTKQADGSLNFLVVGDWGRKGHYNQSHVAYQMGRIGEDLNPEFIISTGDNFYQNGLKGLEDPNFLQSFSHIYTAKSLQKTWYAVLGNHDYRGDVLAQMSPVLKEKDNRWHCERSFAVKYNLSALPSASASEVGCPSAVELFFVDTTPFVNKYWKIPNKHHYDWRGVRPRKVYLSHQLQDLATALRTSHARWKIVIGHHPIRSVGYHGDTRELIRQMLPILEAYNVDLYINGHDHCLEHIKSLNSSMQYLTSGGGSKSWKGINKLANMSGLEMYYNGQGFMSVTINDTDVQAKFYDVEGNAIHKLEMSKSAHNLSGEKIWN